MEKSLQIVSGAVHSVLMVDVKVTTRPKLGHSPKIEAATAFSLIYTSKIDIQIYP